MPANVAPIFTRLAANAWGTITTANTAKDGTGTVVTIFTADATNGGYVHKIIVRALGTNAVSVLRVFLNNGSTNGTASNNTLVYERSLPATTLSETSEQVTLEIPVNLALAPGYKLNCTIGTTVAAGWAVSAHGGQY